MEALVNFFVVTQHRGRSSCAAMRRVGGLWKLVSRSLFPGTIVTHADAGKADCLTDTAATSPCDAAIQRDGHESGTGYRGFETRRRVGTLGVWGWARVRLRPHSCRYAEVLTARHRSKVPSSLMFCHIVSTTPLIWRRICRTLSTDLAMPISQDRVHQRLCAGGKPTHRIRTAGICLKACRSSRATRNSYPER